MNKVTNFGDSSHITVEMRDCFWLSGAKMAPLSWNRVKVAILNKVKVMVLKDIFESIFFFLNSVNENS